MTGSTGWTLCGLARDAGCRLPILLVTGDEDRLATARAEGLGVTVLCSAGLGPAGSWRDERVAAAPGLRWASSRNHHVRHAP